MMRMMVPMLILVAAGFAGICRAGDRDDASPAFVNAGLLGQFEGMRDFCIKADPASARAYDRAIRGFTQSIDHHAMERARESGAYRQGFRAIISLLESVPRADRVATCASLFAPSPV